MEYDQLREMATQVLATIVDDRDVDFVISEDLDVWCDVIDVDPTLFRERFWKLIKRDLDVYKETPEFRLSEKERKKEGRKRREVIKRK